jgi:PHD/YefM family antitoxin component YafN of YafNO toxin-antitoxin module
LAKAQTELGRVARRAQRNKEYFILEEDGEPVIGIMDADELEDYLELRDPVVQRHIRESNEDVRAGRTRPFEEFLAELQSRGRPRGPKGQPDKKRRAK